MIQLKSSHPEFEGPFLKLRRASEHLSELKQIIKAHLEINIKAARTKPGKYGKNKILEIGTPVPKRAAVVIGDLIHNLRSSLDQAYCELVEESGGVVDRWTYFPFHDDREKLVSAIENDLARSRGPKSKYTDFIIDGMMPYKENGSEIYNIKSLSNLDKHRLIIPLITTLGVERIDILNADGSVSSTISQMELISEGHRNNRAFIGLRGGAAIKFHGDISTAFQVRMGPDQPFANEKIIDAMSRLVNLVDDSLLKLVKL